MESGLPLLRPSSVSPYCLIWFIIKFANHHISKAPKNTPHYSLRCEQIQQKQIQLGWSPGQDREEIHSSLLSSQKTSQPCTPELCTMCDSNNYYCQKPTWGRGQCLPHICERAQYKRPHSDHPVQPVEGEICCILLKTIKYSVYYRLTVFWSMFNCSYSIMIRGWGIEPGNSRSGSRRQFHTQGTCWKIHSCRLVAKINNPLSFPWTLYIEHCPFKFPKRIAWVFCSPPQWTLDMWKTIWSWSGWSSPVKKMK